MTVEGRPLAILTEESERQLEALRRGIKRAAGFVFYVVVAKDLGRVELLRRLRAWSGVAGFPNLHFFGTGEQGVLEVGRFLAETEEKSEVAGAVISDGGALIDVDSGSVLATLNVSRDVLDKKIKGPLLLVLPAEREGDMAGRAPDLFDVRSGTLTVEGKAMQAGPILLATIAADLDGAPRPLIEIHAEAARLRALGESEEPPHGALSDAWARLGQSFLSNGELGEAREAARFASRFARDVGYSHGEMVAAILEGRVLQEADEFDEARARYDKALALATDIGSLSGTAWVDFQIGVLAQIRGELEDASRWYQQALAIQKDLNFTVGVIAALLELSSVSILRGRLDEANTWCQQAFEAAKQSNDTMGIADSCRQLGILAQLGGDLERARAWYELSVEQLSNHAGAAVVYGLLASVAEQQGRIADALELNIRSVSRAMGGSGEREVDLTDFARLTAALGLPTLEAAWQRVTGQPLPAHVRAYVEEELPKAQPAPGRPPEPSA